MKTLYRNDIYEMDSDELMEALENYNVITALEVDELEPEDVIELIEAEQGHLYLCEEDDILDTIYNGNWTSAVEQMMDTDTGYMFPSQIADYIADERYCSDSDAFEWFDLRSMSALCDVFYSAREAQRRVA